MFRGDTLQLIIIIIIIITIINIIITIIISIIIIIIKFLYKITADHVTKKHDWRLSSQLRE